MSSAESSSVTVEANIEAVFMRVLKSGSETTADGQHITSFDATATGPSVRGVGDRSIIAGAVTDAEARQARFISRRGWGMDADQIRYPGDGVLALVGSDIRAMGKVALQIPDRNELIVSLPTSAPVDESSVWSVGIHKSTLPAVDLGDEAAKEFTDYLAAANPAKEPRDVRLFAAYPGGTRAMRKEYQLAGIQHRILGADGTPLTLANNASLELLDPAARDKIRAGANIWLDGLPPFAEERICTMKIGDLLLKAVNGCQRCVATDVNPATGEMDHTFLKALSEAGRRGVSVCTTEKGLYFAVGLALPDIMHAASYPVNAGDTAVLTLTDQPFVQLRT